MEQFKRKYLDMVLISPKNPLSSSFFKSETSIREEKLKQMNSKHRYIVHPLSMFRLIYEVYLTCLYITLLITKPLTGALSLDDTQNLPIYLMVSMIADICSWTDIGATFFMGYIQNKSKIIVMDPDKIVKNYVYSIYFFVDILSCCPKYFMVVIQSSMPISRTVDIVCGVVITLNHLKLIRLITLIQLIYKLSHYFNIRSKGKVFWFATFVIMILIIHWISCLQLTLPRLVRHYFSSTREDYKSWLSKYGLKYMRIHHRYLHSFFKTTACLLGIRINLYEMYSVEDYFLVIFTYIIGKIVVCAVWIVIIVNILNNRSMDIKFFCLINQLEEYMRQKQLPCGLKQKFLQFYNFKFPRKYFQDTLIHSMLSGRLRKDINLHVCRKLITNVSIFADLSLGEVSNVVDLLVPEIFLPKDTIIQSGTSGDTMYFLFTGTVAVYTHSGKEVCHLQDGSYFGEISLLFKDYLRSATIVAIEITEVYRLNRKDFEKTLRKNTVVLDKIQRLAHRRITQTRAAEEAYKMRLFEQTHGAESATQPN